MKERKRVLIYGPRKAGTTLLQRLMDGGGLHVYPRELKLKKLADAGWTNGAEMCAEYERLHIDRPRPGELLKAFGYTGDHAARNQETFGPGDLIECAVELTAEAFGVGFEGDDGWVAKEVGGDTTKVIRLWKVAFPSGKVVMIVRDPARVSRAVLMDRRKKGRKLSVREILKEVRAPWRVLEEQVRYLGRRDVFIISYEQLTAETERTMRSIACFLGLEYRAQMAEPTELGKATIVDTSSKKVAHVFNESPRLSTGLSGRESVLLVTLKWIHELYWMVRPKSGFTSYSKVRERIWT